MAIAEFKGEVLEQDGHQIGQEDDGKEGVAELRAAREVGRPVARVHVADGDDEAGPGEGAQLAPAGAARGHGDAAVDLGQGGALGREAPAGRFSAGDHAGRFGRRRDRCQQPKLV